MTETKKTRHKNHAVLKFYLRKKKPCNVYPHHPRATRIPFITQRAQLHIRPNELLLKKSYKSWKIKSGQEEDVDVKVTLPSTYDATPQTAFPGWLADFHERAMSLLSAAPITCVYAY